MTDDAGYSGWTNYETWAVNLWLNNDESSQNWLLEIAADEHDDAPHCIQVRDGIWTVEQARKYNLADRLREEIEEGSPLNDEPSMYSDLLGAALSEVEWHEIAEHALQAYTEGLEYA